MQCNAFENHSGYNVDMPMTEHGLIDPELDTGQTLYNTSSAITKLENVTQNQHSEKIIAITP